MSQETEIQILFISAKCEKQKLLGDNIKHLRVPSVRRTAAYTMSQMLTEGRGAAAQVTCDTTPRLQP